MLRLALTLGLLLAVSAPAALAQTAGTASDPTVIVPPAERAEPGPPPGGPLIPSFQRRDATKAGGPANELNTGDRRATERPPGGDAAAAVSGADLYHGNYCGAGNRGDDAMPTDPLDAVCKRHDDCFEQTNRACSCNLTLRNEAFRVSEMRGASRELRARAAAIVQAAPAIPCRDGG
jgi:hypothetical protein